MAKKFLYIIDPLSSLNPQTDTTLAIMEEAGSRGHDQFVCELHDIALSQGRLSFLATPVSIARGYTEVPQETGAAREMDAAEFAVIFMRKDPPVDQAFFTALLMLRHRPPSTLMMNSPDGLLMANEKLFGLSIAPQLFPRTVVASDRDVLLGFIRAEGTVAIKPLFGAGGAGVLILDKDDRNLLSALEMLTSSFTKAAIAQSYIKDARAGDKRIIILGGKPLGAILRVPSDGDHRANFHAGGSAHETTLTDNDRAIVAAIGPALVANGLHLVGIDVIGGFLTEINVTSPTCVIEIEQYANPPLARSLRAHIVDYVEERLA